jgi:endoglucanase
VLAVALAAGLAGGTSHGRPTIADLASQDTDAFLAGYVEPDGRVVRRDQNGDTVSEGQAYGLLLAQSVGDHGAFARIWAWTKAHLQRPDGLLAYHANGSGTVTNTTPASDADVLSAWALARATGPGAAGYHVEGRRMASAVLSLETVRRGGALMLAAGPWATGEPATLDPSYWSLGAFDELARLTRDPRWLALSHSTETLASSLTGGGARLPPDWARVDGTAVTATPAPNRQAPRVQYGLDAQRLVVWFAASCDPAARRLAARWWPIVSAPGRAGALALALSGAVLNAATNATPLVATAAAAGAAGRQPQRDRLLDDAANVQSRHATYYGAAWLALGHVLLGTRALGGCAGGTG